MKRIYFLVVAVVMTTQLFASWSFTGGCMYFDNSQTQWNDGTVMLIIGKSTYSSVYPMMPDPTTAERWMCDLPSSGWSDAEYMAVISSSTSWNSGNFGPDNLVNASHYSAAYTAGLSSTAGQGFLFSPQSATNGCTLKLTYLGTGYDGITFSATEKNNCFKIDEANQQVTFIFSTSSKRFNIAKSDVSKVYVYGSLSVWDKADEGYRLSNYSSDGCFYRTLPFKDVERVGNCGQVEFLFHVVKSDNSEYDVRSHSSWEGGIDSRLVFDNKMLLPMPGDDWDEIAARWQYAKYVKPLSEWNLTDSMEQARISNFRRVPGTKHLYRSYHPFDPARAQYDTEVKRLYYVRQFAEQFGIQCDIALSGDMTSHAGNSYSCGGKNYTITIPDYYKSIIANNNVLYVGTKNGHTPDFNNAIYYSDGERFAQWIQEVVEFIIDDAHPGPFQIHCALGADRTGAFSETIGALCDANWEDLSYDYYRTSELRIEEYRHPNTIRYSLRHMCGVDPATDPSFNEAVKQHFIQGGWLTAEQIKALKAKLNKTDGTTGIEESAVSNQPSDIQKVMKDGMLYIERNGETYSITGQKLR
ncbi:MAG: tyrosine-protein phosphatase [Paludibacteraceae bacterium]|nr:tyrosine-protein phosphatase [Paludibacteraceae bacterium]